MRALTFAKRTAKEMVRDPLSYIFCVGFPLFMLALFALINNYSGGNTPWFTMKALTPGVTVFSYSFLMLQLSLLVSRDRSSSFIARLCSTPMRAVDFIVGYALPALIVALAQAVVCFGAGAIISAISGAPFSFAASVLSVIASLPAVVLFIGLGILFGVSLSENSAPAITSVLITLSGITGGVWMPLETMGGFETVCSCLPFYPAVTLTKTAFAGIELTLKSFTLPLITTLAYTLAVCSLAVILFNKKSKNK